MLTISHIQWFPAVGGGSYLCAEALGRCDAAQLGAFQCSFGLWYCPLWAVQDHHHPTAQPIPCQVSNCTVCAACTFNVWHVLGSPASGVNGLPSPTNLQRRLVILLYSLTHPAVVCAIVPYYNYTLSSSLLSLPFLPTPFPPSPLSDPQACAITCPQENTGETSSTLF